ncbi:MAG: tyrosine-type recombinase/integrase [Caldilineaceae bacterium]
MEFSELIEEFLLSKRAQQKSHHTIAWYGDHLKVFYRWLAGQQKYRNPLAVQTIEAYYNYRRDSGVKPVTIHGDHRSLRVFYRWLRDDRNLIAESPVERIRMDKPDRDQPRRIDVDYYRSLMESIPPTNWVDLRDRMIISMLFLCGIRVGEAVGVMAKDVDVLAKTMRVRGKTGTRSVPLLPPVVEDIIAYIYVRPAYQTDHLLLSAKGDFTVRGLLTTNGVRQLLRRRAEQAGLEYFNPHAYRHGLAMHLLNKGGDMSLVQKVLGHSRIATTAENYASWLTEDLNREFSARMESAIKRKAKDKG